MMSSLMHSDYDKPWHTIRRPRTVSSAWYVKFPLDAYALGPLRFEKPISEREARAEARRFHHGIDRQDRPLPRGTQVWPAV
jgi:hypothetical protein